MWRSLFHGPATSDSDLNHQARHWLDTVANVRIHLALIAVLFGCRGQPITEALRLVRRAKRRHKLKMRTLAADKGYAAGAFLHELEVEEGVVPLVAMPKVPIRSEGPEAEARRRA